MEQGETTRKGFYYGWWIVIGGSLIMAICHAAVYSCASLFVKPVCEAMGFTRSAFSAYLTTSAIGTMLSASLMGRFLESRNTKRIMLLCLFAFVAVFAGFSMATSLWQFYLLGVLQTVAYSGVGLLPLTILINKWFGPKKKGLAMSLTFAGSGLGGMILSPLVTEVILRYSWRAGYAFLGVTALVVALPVILCIVVNTPGQKGLRRIGETQESVGEQKSGLTAQEARRTPMFWLMLFGILLNNVGCCSVLSQGASYFSDIGFGMEGAVKIVALGLGCLTLGKIALGALHDKLGTKRTVLLASALMMVEFLCLYLLPRTKVFLVPYILSYSLAMGMGTVSFPLVAAYLFGEKDYGAIVGVVNMGGSLGNAVGPLVAAGVYDLTQSYQLAWILMIGIGAVSMVCFFLSFRLRERQGMPAEGRIQ